MRRAAVLLVLGLVPFMVSGTGAREAGDDIRHFVILATPDVRPAGALAAAISASRGRATAVLEEVGVVFADSADPAFVTRLKRHATIEDAAEDTVLQWIPQRERPAAAPPPPAAAGVNSEPFAALQWSLRQIHADTAAAAGDRGSGIVRARVAVIDDGIYSSHEDLAPNVNLSLSRSFVNGEALEAPPGFSHGTHVAGIIAAPINGVGTQGVAPEAEIVAVKVLSAATGAGSFTDLIRGIVYGAGPEVDADVLNLSLSAAFDRKNAGGGGAGVLLAALNRAIAWATQQGALVVCAAGNDALDLNGRVFVVPAQSGNGMAVAATGPVNFAELGSDANFDLAASYTNRGASVVDVAAPGGDYTLYPAPGYVWDMIVAPGGTYADGTDAYYLAAGTSMAAPHVSGLAALVVGKYGRMKPAQLRAIIEESADDILKPGTDALGRGRINAARALRLP